MSKYWNNFCSSECLFDTFLFCVWIATLALVRADPAWSSHSSVWSGPADERGDAGPKTKQTGTEGACLCIQSSLQPHTDTEGVLSRWKKSHIPLKWASLGWKLWVSSPHDPRPCLYLCRGSPDPGLCASLTASWGVRLGWPDKPTVLPSGVLVSG